MKKILIATDFSAASHNASVFGAEFAKVAGTDMILFNAYKVPSAPPALNVSVSRYDIKMQTDKKLMDEANVLDAGKMNVEIVCDEGVPEKVIMDIAAEKHADLIVAGMKGGNKNLKKIFGSTASSLAKTSKIPLLIVPENARFKKPRVIVFAIDIIYSHDELPERLTEISKLFNAKVYAVKVAKDEQVNEENAIRVVSESKDQSVKVFEYFTQADVTQALDEFIKKYNGDILAMIPHKHEWIEQLFVKSETKEMIFHAHIPLLILPDNA